MFIDRTIVVGALISVAGLALATAVLVYALTTLTTPQVVRLVGLVPSPGTVILDDVGDSATLTVQGYYSDLSTEDLDPAFITYESTDPVVVTVSPDGTATAKGSGSADILVEFGSFRQRVHTIVFGTTTIIPRIDPSKVGVIPGLEVDIRAVLDRVIIELQPGNDVLAAAAVASNLGGEVLYSYDAFPGHVITFDTAKRTLLQALEDAAADYRVAAAYPDILFEATDHPIDTLSLQRLRSAAYRKAGFDKAWRIVEKVGNPSPVVISVVELGVLNVTGPNEPQIVASEFDPGRIHAPPTGLMTDPHAAGVTSVIAALNGNVPPRPHRNADRNFSGIVTSPGNLHYDILALTDDQFLDLANVLRQLQTINANANAIDVVNMSFAVRSGFLRRTFVAWLGAFFKPYEVRFKTMIEDMPEVTFVPGAGNCQVEASSYLPARFSQDLENVITVGGANSAYDGRWTSLNPFCPPDGIRGNSSSFGDAVTIAAPAKGVWSVDINNNGYNPDGGTSFAAPMVTGAVALLKAIDPDINPVQVRELLRSTADDHDICTLSVSPCPPANIERWGFLRADRAVAGLLSERVGADIADRITVPSNTQRTMGNRFEIGVEIENTGELQWPFYAEAFVRSPQGLERGLDSLEIAVGPGRSHPFRWGFWPTETGCWDLRVKVWMDDDPAGHLRATLAELDPNAQETGLLADSGWREEVLEVRPSSGEDVQCSNAHTTIPLPKGLTRIDANVLLLADTSGSMEGQKIEALKQAVHAFVNRMYDIRIQGKGGVDQRADYVGLSDFDDDFQQVVQIDAIGSTRSDLDGWKSIVDHLDADGGTAFYDAVINSIDILNSQGAPARNNILIALTDGLDQDSQSSFSEARDALSASSVTLFALALSEPGGAGEYDLELLKELADATGGAAYVADIENLTGLYLLFSTIFETEP